MFHLYVSPFLLLPGIVGACNRIVTVRCYARGAALCDLRAPGWGEPWFPHWAVLLPSQFQHGDFGEFAFRICDFCFSRHTILRPGTMISPLLNRWRRLTSLPITLRCWLFFDLWLLCGVFCCLCFWFVG